MKTWLLFLSAMYFLIGFRLLYILKWRMQLMDDDWESYKRLPSAWKMVFSIKPLKYWIK